MKRIKQSSQTTKIHYLEHILHFHDLFFLVCIYRHTIIYLVPRHIILIFLSKEVSPQHCGRFSKSVCLCVYVCEYVHECMYGYVSDCACMLACALRDTTKPVWQRVSMRSRPQIIEIQIENQKNTSSFKALLIPASFRSNNILHGGAIA